MSSKWLEENFADKKELLYYTLDDYKNLAENIEIYLHNEEMAENIISSAHSLAVQSGTWLQRAKEIWELYVEM